MRLLRALALSLALTPINVRSQQAAPRPATTSAPRVLNAVRRGSPITIDGKLDDATWATAPVESAFLVSYPQPNTPAPNQTQVRVAYDDEALYVAVRMLDPHPDSIAAGLAGRDAGPSTGIYSDWVYVSIDSYHDRRTAFLFGTTPRGVKKDIYISDDGNEDANWDAVWEVAA